MGPIMWRRYEIVPEEYYVLSVMVHRERKIKMNKTSAKLANSGAIIRVLESL
jgi:hypothetical protein